MFDEIIKEIETRCSNKLETQSTIAASYANMLNYLDFISDDKIKIANAAVKARYPSKSGFARVKKLAWEIAEKRQRAQHRVQLTNGGQANFEGGSNAAIRN